MVESSRIADRQIARAAGLVFLAFVIGNLTGLVRQILVANAFGTSTEIEAFNAANRVSETLFLLVAGGALSSAFIPTFTSLLAKDKRNDAWRLASAITNLMLIILVLASGIMAIFAPALVRYVLAPGFADFPIKEALTIQLLRLMLPSAVIFGLSGLVMGILNSHQVFLVPALAPSMYQIGMIIGVVGLAPKFGIQGLGYGVLIGACLHLLLQVPSLVRLKGEYSPILGLKLQPVREVALLMAPRLLGVAVVQLNFWVNIRLASKMPEGSVTALVLGFALMLMPQAAIAQSIAVAAMPTFSSQYALGKMSDLRTSLTSSLRAALILAFPATAGLILLREPIIRVLYERGEFNEYSTMLVSWALLWYTTGLIGHCLVEILSRSFYAMHDTRTPVLVGVLAMSMNIGLSFLLSRFFERLGWMPHGGLALANSIATTVEGIFLLVLVKWRLQGLEKRRLLGGVVWAAASTALMSASLVLWLFYASALPNWLVLGVSLFLGGAVFAISAYFFGLSEVSFAIHWVLRRFRSLAQRAT